MTPAVELTSFYVRSVQNVRVIVSCLTWLQLSYLGISPFWFVLHRYLQVAHYINMIGTVVPISIAQILCLRLFICVYILRFRRLLVYTKVLALCREWVNLTILTALLHFPPTKGGEGKWSCHCWRGEERKGRVNTYSMSWQRKWQKMLGWPLIVTYAV